MSGVHTIAFCSFYTAVINAPHSESWVANFMLRVIFVLKETSKKGLVASKDAFSRCDDSLSTQAVTDVRMWLRNELITIKNHLIGLLEVFCNLAESNLHVIFPGYTHLQRAQPVRFSHFLMSHASAIKRDYDRLNHIEAEVDVLPLGSGAIAGHPLGLDRKRLADSLNFSQVSMNSMDAVSDR